MKYITIIILLSFISCENNKHYGHELTKEEADSIANTVDTTEIDSDDLYQANWSNYNNPLWNEKP